MSGRAAIALGEWVPTADQRVVTYGVPWAHYEAQLALRGERASPRIAYLSKPTRSSAGSTFPPTVRGR